MTVDAKMTGTMVKTASGYDFLYESQELLIRLTRLTDDLESNIRVVLHGETIHTSKINLMATRSVSELAKTLSTRKGISWPDLLNHIRNEISDAMSDGGQTEDIDEPPESMAVNYLIDPILPLYHPTTMFAAGGIGKSIFCDYLAVLVQFGICSQNGLLLTPCQMNVLYLDWENTAEEHRRYVTAIKRGLNITDRTTIAYRHMDRPLANVVDSLTAEIERLDAGLIIIDSQMAATGGSRPGMTAEQIASEYYNILASWQRTTLTIDHVTKVNMNPESDTNNGTAFGTVVKYNRARSQFEFKPGSLEDGDHHEYALVHKKFNLGRKQKPMGIAADFENNGNELVRITYSSCELKDNPGLSRALPNWERVKNCLLDKRASMTPGEISGMTGIDPRTVSMCLSHYAKTFIQVDRNKHTWGIKAHG